MTYQNIMRLIPAIQSAHLVGENVKVLNKKTDVKDITKLGVKNIVGISFIKVEADLIGGL